MEGIGGGGDGVRGSTGQMLTVRYAREHRVPYLGIGRGLQLAVIEFARHAAGLTEANSTAFAPQTPQPVIHAPRAGRSGAGHGPGCLGGQVCRLEPGSLARAVYGQPQVRERYRQRQVFNRRYLAPLQDAGLHCSGWSLDGRLVALVELPDHPWFLACQFHPEFTSTPRAGHPLFTAFIRAALAQQARGGAAPG